MLPQARQQSPAGCVSNPAQEYARLRNTHVYTGVLGCKEARAMSILNRSITGLAALTAAALKAAADALLRALEYVAR